jgi:hypothetical protein
MPLEVPARQISSAWKQRVSAGLGLRGMEDELDSAAFLLYRVIAPDCDLPVGLETACGAITKGKVIRSVGECRDAQCGRHAYHDQTFEEVLDFRAHGCGHGVNYNRSFVAPAGARRVFE